MRARFGRDGAARREWVSAVALYPWSDWHGGEALGVKILEVANLPALIVTGTVHVAGMVVGATRLVPACGWSWILAGGFLAVASAQWWLVGLLVDRLRDRLKGVAGVL